MRRALIVAAALSTLVLSACGESAPEPTDSSSGSLGPSTRLVSLGAPGRTVPLFELFNADQGVPRLVLLVSPT
jgi:hypothetical protein